MTNIVLLVRDRPRLTEQALRTLFQNTPKDQFTLTICDDGSWPETAEIIRRYANYENVEVVTFRKSVGIVGFLRNVGAATSERVFGRGEYLYHGDNDVAVFPGWLAQMTASLNLLHEEVKLVGGYRHPFHGLTGNLIEPRIPGSCRGIEPTDAVAGYSHLMRWSTWDAFGPYDQHAKGVCQSEDYSFCQRIINARGVGGSYEHPNPLLGYKVGYIHPPVIAVCGVTNTENKPAIGSDQIPRVPGLVYV